MGVIYNSFLSLHLAKEHLLFNGHRDTSGKGQGLKYSGEKRDGQSENRAVRDGASQGQGGGRGESDGEAGGLWELSWGTELGVGWGERLQRSFQGFLLCGVQCNALLCLPINPLVKIYIIAFGS